MNTHGAFPSRSMPPAVSPAGVTAASVASFVLPLRPIVAVLLLLSTIATPVWAQPRNDFVWQDAEVRCRVNDQTTIRRVAYSGAAFELQTLEMRGCTLTLTWSLRRELRAADQRAYATALLNAAANPATAGVLLDNRPLTGTLRRVGETLTFAFSTDRLTLPGSLELRVRIPPNTYVYAQPGTATLRMGRAQAPTAGIRPVPPAAPASQPAARRRYQVSAGDLVDFVRRNGYTFRAHDARCYAGPAADCTWAGYFCPEGVRSSFTLFGGRPLADGWTMDPNWFSGKRTLVQGRPLGRSGSTVFTYPSGPPDDDPFGLSANHNGQHGYCMALPVLYGPEGADWHDAFRR